MRHGNRRTKIGKMTSHRKAMMRNMTKSLFKYQKIETTLRRAKEVRRLAERLITIAKENDLAARRRVFAVLTDRDMVSKLFNEIVPLFKTRNSGYTRIIRLGFRRGDAASMAIIELTEKNVVAKAPRKKKEGEKAEAGKAEKSKARKDKAAKDESADLAAVNGSAKEEVLKEEKKEEAKPKTVHKAKAHIEEGKRAEKAKQEDKKIDDKKKFLKNLRGFFHRKTDM